MSLLNRVRTGNQCSGEWPTVSVEEAMILEGEAATDIASADTTMNEVQAMHDRADVMEDTADYIDNNVGGEETPVTQNEAVLTEQVAALGAQGTGSEAEDVVPSLESYIGGTSRVSTEGIREMVRSFWAMIKEGIKKVWGLLSSYYRKMTSRLSSVVKSAKALRDLAKAKQGKSAGDTKKITVSRSVTEALSADKKIGGAADIISNVKELGSAAEKSCNDYSPAILSLGKKIESSLNDVDEDNVHTTLATLNKNMHDLGNKATDKIPGSLSNVSGDKRFTDSKVVTKRGPILAGHRAIFVSHASGEFKSGEGEETARENATFVQSLSISLSAATDKDRELADTDIDLFTASQASTLADEIISICDRLRNYSEGRGYDELQKQRNKIESAGDKVSAKMGKLEDRRASDDGEAGKNMSAVRSLRSIQRYVTMWTSMSKNPTMSLTNHSISTMRHAMTVATSSMNKLS